MIVPDFDRTGGYERQAFFLARHFVRQGLRVRLITNVMREEHAPYEIRDGVRIHRLAPLGRPNLPNLFASFLLFLRQHRHEFDVVHCHAFTFLSAACVPIGKLLKKPVLVKVATQRDVQEFASRAKPGMGTSWFFLRRAARLLAISDAIREEFAAHRIAGERVAVCPNGVDTESFDAQPRSPEQDALRARCNAGPDDALFVYSGRLVERKAVDVLLRAWARMQESAARLAILGDGDERASLEALRDELGLGERCRFFGEIEDVRPWLHAGDAFAFPSRLEGLPNALLEAMACGLPPVVARIGGCVDVVRDGESGLIFDTDDVSALTGALDTLAGSSELRTRMGAAARARVESAFSFASVGARLQEIYAGACGA